MGKTPWTSADEMRVKCADSSARKLILSSFQVILRKNCLWVTLTLIFQLASCGFSLQDLS